MKKSRYTFERTSVVNEMFVTEATSEEEARQNLANGDYESQIVEFIDWADDNYDLVHVEDHLVNFIRSKEHQ